MKNILKIIFAILIMTFILTGCGMKTYVGMIINKDKTIKVEYTTAMDDEAIDLAIGMNNSGDNASGDLAILQSAKTYTDEERWAYIEQSTNSSQNYNGYKKSKYNKDGYKGTVFSKVLDGTIDDYVGDGENVDFASLSEDDKMFTKKNGHYYLYIDLGGSGDNYSDAKYYKEQGADMDYKFYISLPKPAVKHNATIVTDDPLTYSWDLLEANSIELEFDLGESKDYTPVIIWIVIIAFVVLILGLSIYKMISSKKKENE